MLKAKRALEEMLRSGRAVLALPTIEDRETLERELAASGISARSIDVGETDVRAVRETLGLTQEQFSLRYGLDLDSVQNWEAGRRTPDRATRSYLRVIERLPDQSSDALEQALAPD